MLDRFFATRHNIFMVITTVYVCPCILLMLYASFYLPASLRWSLASMGLLVCSLGGLVLFLSMHKWEIKLLENSTTPFGEVEIDREEEQRVFALLEETKNRCQQLEELLSAEHTQLQACEVQLKEKKNQLTALAEEKEVLQKQYANQKLEYDTFKSSVDERLEQKMMFITACQQTIQEQHTSLESKQQQIAQLESKVRDLTYEIKTLLQLAEKAESIAKQGVSEMLFPVNNLATHTAVVDEPKTLGDKVNSDIQALHQLKLYIKAAQKITGSGHYGSRLARMRDLSIDSYALDLRHLTESFSADNSCVILFYSAKENKPLYVNSQIKELLEWTPEKFLQNFVSIIQDAEEPWKGMQAQLAYKHEVLASLTMKNKAGKSIAVHCALGLIPTGIFRGNYLAVFY